MNPFEIPQVFAATGRVYAALLLGWAAAGKLRDPAGFEGVLAGFRLLPRAALSLAARGLPWLEAAAALLLVTPGVAGKIGVFGAAGLLGVFGAAVAVNLARGRRMLDCGCGGPPRPAGPALAMHNLLLAAALLATPLAPPAGAAVLALAAAAGATAFLLNLAQAELASVAARPA